jgi:hypothetical protein
VAAVGSTVAGVTTARRLVRWRPRLLWRLWRLLLLWRLRRQLLLLLLWLMLRYAAGRTAANLRFLSHWLL